MSYPLPGTPASTNYMQLTNAGPQAGFGFGIPYMADHTPVLDACMGTSTAAATNTSMIFRIEGVNVIQWNMAAAQAYTFLESFPNGYPIAPTENTRDAYTTADNISYLVQGGTLGGNERAAQTWTTTGTGSLGIYQVKYADINIDKVGAPTDGVFLEFHSLAPGGTLLSTSFTIPATDISTTKGYIRFTFPNVPGITSSSTKFSINLRRTGSRDTSNYYRWYGTNTSGMANGGAYSWSGDILSAESGTDDLNFRIYSGTRVDLSISGSNTNNAFTIWYHYVRTSQIRD